MNLIKKMLGRNYEFLYVNSKNRVSGVPSNFKCNLPNSILNYKSISLETVCIPNVIPNIITRFNDNICWFHSSTNYNISVSGGIYSITELINIILREMNAINSNNYNITLNSVTFKLTFTGTISFKLNWLSNLESKTSCAYVLEFNETDTSLNTSITAQNPINLSQPNNLLCYICEFGSRYLSTNSCNMTTFLISLESSEGNLVYYSQEKFIQEFELNSSYPINSITCTLSDDDCNIINLELNFTMVFKLHY
jgi:hypothetical protein